MIAIPQCLDFTDIRLTREICDFYLKMLEIKNRAIYLHSQQVANYAASTAAKLGLPASEVLQIKTAALLHDIGQLSVPNIILAKLPFLSTRELSIYKRHCIAGASMLENIPEFTYITDIIRCHHEKWDGTGYPKRLKGQNIPIGARIVAVANYYDRNINPCTQHWQKTHTEAIIELQNKAGLDFDPSIVKAFIESVIPLPEKNNEAKK
ncbi:HD domain-containing phosphohydrolase [uncultured Phascolarctobacterium sp.]|uniref:HD-GYP domain-containing protein n=1 Tax=uncultured Phascolarctobacterium sp. TaxID=512296 RepID=UPI0025F2DCBF|nr:HD domain-containing phosphohydrolase [uncultured Phascolarctobacterium sp.]